MVTTARLGLTKPGGSDNIDVTVLDTNFDTLDLKMCTQVCTSGTHPSSPFTGQLIYETDTGAVRVWTGSAWVSVTTIGVACTSSTRPSGPSAGQVIFETDTKLSFVWNGAAWVPIPAGAFACTSSTHPADPGAGSLIYETDTGSALVYSGSAWVPLLDTGGPATVGATGTTAAVRVQTTSTLTSNRAVGLRKSGDAQDAYSVDFGGKTQWGPGGSTTPDTNLYRSGVGALTTDGSLTVGGRLSGPQVLGVVGSATGVTSTEADVTGATITFTTTKAGTVVWATASFDFSIGTGSTGLIQGKLNVDGANQTPVATATFPSTSGRASCSQSWPVTLASAGSHTFKLRAVQATGQTVNTNTNTTLSLIVFDF